MEQELQQAVNDGGTKRIKSMNFFRFFICFRERKRIDYRRKLNQASSMIEKEMDLGRFIQKQRLHTLAILGLLGGRQ